MVNYREKDNVRPSYHVFMYYYNPVELVKQSATLDNRCIKVLLEAIRPASHPRPPSLRMFHGIDRVRQS